MFDRMESQFSGFDKQFAEMPAKANGTSFSHATSTVQTFGPNGTGTNNVQSSSQQSVFKDGQRIQHNSDSSARSSAKKFANAEWQLDQSKSKDAVSLSINTSPELEALIEKLFGKNPDKAKPYLLSRETNAAKQIEFYLADGTSKHKIASLKNANAINNAKLTLKDLEFIMGVRAKSQKALLEPMSKILKAGTAQKTAEDMINELHANPHKLFEQMQSFFANNPFFTNSNNQQANKQEQAQPQTNTSNRLNQFASQFNSDAAMAQLKQANPVGNQNPNLN